MQKTKGEPRNSVFDLLKLFLALLVLFSHSYELLQASTGEEAPALFNRSPGNVAVHVFFVLSGYFITMSAHHARSIGDYLWKRFIRIIPVYVIAIFFSHQLGNACNLFSDLPTPYIVNGCVWTLYYEIALYLCVALMQHFRVLKKEVVGTLGCILFLAAMVTVQSTNPLATVILPMLFMFVIGSYSYLAYEEATIGRGGIWSIIGLVIIQFFPNIFDAIEKKIPLVYGPDLSISLLLAAYLISLPTFILWLGRLFQVSLSRFPDLSYGIYLFGWPIQQTIIYYFRVIHSATLSPMLLFGLSTIASLIVATVMWYGLEIHCLKMKNWYWLVCQKLKQMIIQRKRKKQT